MASSSLRPSRFNLDKFTIALVVTVLLATALPCRDQTARAFDALASIAICLLFLMQGARLPRTVLLAGMTHWRLHLLILASTFVLFPILGMTLHALFPDMLNASLWPGVLFLCALPSTVQSSIAFTAIGKGNVAAAICSATASNIVAIFLSPALASIMLPTNGGTVSAASVEQIVLLLLVPFCIGQLLHGTLGSSLTRAQGVVALLDRGSILLIVYVAFSGAVVQGIWSALPPAELVQLLVVIAVIFASALAVTAWASRRLGFSKSDEVAIVFCGSKKSLVTGIPMAKVLLVGPALGFAVLPLIIFHQLQLFACAWLAGRYAQVSTTS